MGAWKATVGISTHYHDSTAARVAGGAFSDSIYICASVRRESLQGDPAYEQFNAVTALVRTLDQHGVRD